MLRKSTIIVLLFLNYVSIAQNAVENTIRQLKSQPDSSIAKALNDSSFDYRGIDYNLCLEFALKASPYAVKAHDSIQLARSYNFAGVGYHLLNDHKNAVVYYGKAEALFAKLKYWKGVGSARMNMGILYNDIKNHKEALKSYQKALPIFVQLKDSNNLSNCLNNIGSLYFDIYTYDSSLTYHLRALELRKLLKKERNIGTSYTNIGTVYSEQKKFKEAEECHTKALELNTRANDLRGKLIALSNLGVTKVFLGKTKEGEALLLEGIKLSEDLGSARMKQTILSHLADCYKIKGNHHQAFEYLLQSYTLKDSLNNLDNLQAINELQAKYESEKKENEIAGLNKNNELIQLQLDQKKSEQRFFIFLSILCVVIALLVGYSYFTIKKTNKALHVLNKEIENKNTEISYKSIQLETAFIEIKDSIHYSKRIQDAILPDLSDFKKICTDYFLFYQPKDVVSGDFYYYHPINSNEVIIGVGDCTGHGVPGALMSMIGIEQLNKIIIEQNTHSPAAILKDLNQGIIKALKQDTNDTRDGMDISLCKINFATLQMEYAGANRPIWIYKHDGSFEEVKPDKIPIGGMNQQQQSFSVKEHTVKLHKNDSVYLFSDGFADQFGGEKGKKLMVKNLQQHLTTINPLSMNEQGESLKKLHVNWKGANEQVDDICVLGIKI